MTTRAIFTELYQGQGLGNQLWVYAATRSIAQQLNLPFFIIGQDNFKANDFLNIESEIGISKKDADKIINTKSFKTYYEQLYFDPDLKYLSSDFDNKILELEGVVKIEGHLQSEKYFFNDVERIKNYLHFKENEGLSFLVPKNTCVINLRGGEYKRHTSFLLPETYWISAIKNAKEIWGVDDFIVVTDDYRYAKSIFPKYEIISDSIEKCYKTIYTSNHLIVSNSTFSYFPIKTSKIFKKVIAPLHWGRFGNNFKRWASPANFYTDWLWQNANGEIITLERASDDYKKTINEYNYLYNIKTNINGIKIANNYLKLIPKNIKTNTKLMLSYIFPKKYG
jgi:hypothetical protein